MGKRFLFSRSLLVSGAATFARHGRPGLRRGRALSGVDRGRRSGGNGGKISRVDATKNGKPVAVFGRLFARAGLLRRCLSTTVGRWCHGKLTFHRALAGRQMSLLPTCRRQDAADRISPDRAKISRLRSRVSSRQFRAKLPSRPPARKLCLGKMSDRKLTA